MIITYSDGSVNQIDLAKMSFDELDGVLGETGPAIQRVEMESQDLPQIYAMIAQDPRKADRIGSLLAANIPRQPVQDPVVDRANRGMRELFDTLEENPQLVFQLEQELRQIYENFDLDFDAEALAQRLVQRRPAKMPLRAKKTTSAGMSM